jgi:hypothetical protein
VTDDDGSVGYQRRGQDRGGLRGLSMLCFAIGGRSQD